MPRIDFYAAIAIPSVGVFAYGDELTCWSLFFKQDTINTEVAPPILLIGIVSRDGVNTPYILDLGNLFVGYHCRLNKLFLFGGGDDGEFAVKVSPFSGECGGGAEAP